MFKKGESASEYLGLDTVYLILFVALFVVLIAIVLFGFGKLWK